MRRIIVDHIDRGSNLARLELGDSLIDIDVSLLPPDISEGDALILVKSDNSDIKSDINSLVSKLFK